MIVFIFLATFLLVFIIPELHPADLLPFAEKGLGPSVRGALQPAAWFSEYIVIAFFLPFVQDRTGIVRRGLLSVLFVTLSMILTSMICLLLTSDLTSSFVYPVLIVTRYISVADFVQHLESIVIAIWISAMYVKISLFLYIFSITIAQWLGLKDYRPLVFPATFLSIVVAFWLANSREELGQLISPTSSLYTLLILFVFPALLYLIGIVKKRISAWGDS